MNVDEQLSSLVRIDMPIAINLCTRRVSAASFGANKQRHWHGQCRASLHLHHLQHAPRDPSAARPSNPDEGCCAAHGVARWGG